ncbi:Ribosomal 50S subunit-recycling heat shock protein, contains S4 domain [Alkalithermobacter thermoalcaliphilus JW-YL-7 = DSM 7308]|uniref:RQC P-site tRNA stabilizing factor n=1 Tax=Alkalithermobacter thermoalcaliphilus JW-YL-7 = DSM 7308 TaxID=1121328 RepID=A0A150FSM2_CLOPD|nr:RNA-binding S4 domain protein [[Clostridium] paradoxum JW-YL-7 = DSM 7308]SHK69445.1 Ribosomal 50S subunit-recycling heat shock protein, contains S4 domain [[Clostridium] paradoxum JW-YL-7 = DSM 7308]
MRLDKYLKVSRLIKRRTVAKQACDSGIISINGKVAKSSTQVQKDDIIQIDFKTKPIRVRVLEIKEHALKDDAKQMYEIIE